MAADPLACSAELWPLAELKVPAAEPEGVPLCCVVALGHAGQLGEGRWLARLITFSKTNDAMSKIRERTAIPFTSFSLNPTPPRLVKLSAVPLKFLLLAQELSFALLERLSKLTVLSVPVELSALR